MKGFYWYSEKGVSQPVAVVEDRVYFLGMEYYIYKRRLKGSFVLISPMDTITRSVILKGRRLYLTE